MLESAARCSTVNTWWWVKGDGCDLVSGLQESVRMNWSGDVDLNTGELQAQYHAYRELIDFISLLGLEPSLQLSNLSKCFTLLSAKNQRCVFKFQLDS